MNVHFLNVRYKFWPVGQGLFSSGVLESASFKSPVRWVYDCGTMSAQKFLQSAIADLHSDCGLSSKSKIDLLVISHFDKDHISGLLTLLSNFTVGTLLLPYMPLWQRIWHGFLAGVQPSDPEIRFFISPSSYIAALEGAEIDEILFVTPSEGVDSADVQEEDGTIPLGDDLLIQGTRRSAETDDEKTVTKISGQSKSSVSFLTSRQLTINGVWEFVPYNDAKVLKKSMRLKMPAFQKIVEKQLTNLQAAPTGAELQKLKEIYDNQFGRSSVNRNQISLFLYGGPLNKTRDKYLHVCTERGVAHWNCWDGRDCWHKNAILYTGDGFLNTNARFNALANYLGVGRMDQILCLQVMHHGAKGNWFKGLADKIVPEFSVFCSDPSGKHGHPHGEVVVDFLKYNPIQVDQADGFSIDIRTGFC